MSKKTSNIKILDCTLRDGGYVNNFNFGKENISKIIKGLSSSNVDLIELGFLKDEGYTPNSNQTLFKTVSQAEELLVDGDYSNQEFCLMIRPDWYDISGLEKCTGKIKAIRFALRPEILELTLKQATIARNLGYEIYLNPINTLNYSRKELRDLIQKLNDFNPKGVYIVDTFGSMLPSDLERLTRTYIARLDDDIAIGLHLHENLSLSLALASQFVDMMKEWNREIYIDSSILGMGRIPGNLCTELILNYLNKTLGTEYSLDSIYELIENPISKIKEKTEWGYIPSYAITAFKEIHRSYAEYLSDKSLPLPEIDKILSQIDSENEGKLFNEVLIEDLYKKHLEGLYV